MRGIVGLLKVLMMTCSISHVTARETPSTSSGVSSGGSTDIVTTPSSLTDSLVGQISSYANAIGSALVDGLPSEFVKVTDCDGDTLNVPANGSPVSALVNEYFKDLSAADPTGFVQQIWAQYKSTSSILSLQSTLSISGCQENPKYLTSSAICGALSGTDGDCNVVQSGSNNITLTGDHIVDDLIPVKRLSEDVERARHRSKYIKKKLHAKPKQGGFHSAQFGLTPADLGLSNTNPSLKKGEKLFVVQGDMVMPNEVQNMIELETSSQLEASSRLEASSQSQANTPTSESVTWSAWNLWPQGKVYYTYDNSTIDSCAVSAMTSATSIIEKNTCIRFQMVPFGKSSQTSAVLTSNGTTCWAYVGYTTSSQLNLGGIGCQQPGTAMHEIGHVLGLIHEQSRVNRDQYVTVEWPVVQTGTEVNFYIINSPTSKYQTTTSSSSYDYDSVMHYSAYEFSTTAGSPTLQPTESSALNLMGNRDHLSTQDIAKLNTLYGCTATCNDGIQNADETGVDCGGWCRKSCSNPSDTGLIAFPSSCQLLTPSTSSSDVVIIVVVVLSVVALCVLGFAMYRQRRVAALKATRIQYARLLANQAGVPGGVGAVRVIRRPSPGRRPT